MSSSKIGMFIAWRIFQRRTESLSTKFDLNIKYYYRSWEEKSKFHKAFSYFFKTFGMLRDLIRLKPKVVFIQLPPTPVLYLAAVYRLLTSSKLVADAHNAMIYSKWLSWPFAKYLLRKTDVLLVHNEDVEIYAKRFNLHAITLRDPLPTLARTENPEVLSRYELRKYEYVIVPWSFAPDEPIAELVQAAKLVPNVNFVMTWFAERLPADVRNSLPQNLVLTGFLENTEFCALFAQAGAALVLTTREGTQPSASSEAIVLEVPLIVSDLLTTRKLYKDMPIYIENTVQGIIDGVDKALNNRHECIGKIRAFGKKYGESIDAEIHDIKVILGLAD